MGIRIKIQVTKTEKAPKQSAAQHLANVAEGQRIANAAKNGEQK